LRFFQTTPTCITRHEGKQQVPSSSLLPFQSSPQSEKRRLGFPKKQKSKSSSIHTRRQRQAPKKRTDSEYKRRRNGQQERWRWQV
jgi:hypothetical protein